MRSDPTHRHSGSRWERPGDPNADGPGAWTGEPTVPIPSSAMPAPGRWGPDRSPVDEDDNPDRRRPVLVAVGVLAVLTLLLTGGWFLLPQLRQLGDPVATTSQAPVAGDRHGHDRRSGGEHGSGRDERQPGRLGGRDAGTGPWSGSDAGHERPHDRAGGEPPRNSGNPGSEGRGSASDGSIGAAR